MATSPERRHMVRMMIPSQLSNFGLSDQKVRLLDLKPAGARIETDEPLPDCAGFSTDLPAEVIRRRLAGRKQYGANNERRPSHTQTA